MKLNRKDVLDRDFWQGARVTLPTFDLERMAQATAAHPVWLHFGAGNIFRGFIATLQQELLDRGLAEEGIIAVDSFDDDIIDRIYRPHDNLSLLVHLCPDGSTRRRVVAGVADSLKADEAGMRKLRVLFERPSLQLVSFTITEKGYALKNAQGEFFPVVLEDLEAGPTEVRHTVSMVTALLLGRYRAGGDPLALVSMDNCSRNGEKLQAAVWTVAKAWAERGKVPAGFLAYLSDPERVSFPWSMIDKITPRPAEEVGETLAADGIEGMQAIVTGRNTYIAPFVNAELPQYLVIEDAFPNGRPALEKVGVYLTDRDTVNRTEGMKVMTCLNPLHTALAIFGCLLGYRRIAAEMEDPLLRELVCRIGYGEGMPVVVDPGIIDPKAFLDEVIAQRLPNPFIPDSPQRIATDTSQKMSVRFGETIKAYLADEALDPGTLTCIPLVIAGWIRYLLGYDDQGEVMEISADPLLSSLQDQLAGLVPGQPLLRLSDKLLPVLQNKNIFGLDLVRAGLSGKISDMFAGMMAGPGSVRSTLAAYLQK